ncbi:MAG: BAPKO_0422 family outer member beta-barrel protein [Candidatus Thorarchaeota archaeon]
MNSSITIGSITNFDLGIGVKTCLSSSGFSMSCVEGMEVNFSLSTFAKGFSNCCGDGGFWGISSNLECVVFNTGLD